MAGLIYLRPGQVKLKKNYNAVIQRYINIIAAQKIHNTYLAVRNSVVHDILEICKVGACNVDWVSLQADK